VVHTPKHTPVKPDTKDPPKQGSGAGSNKILIEKDI
jgi:hypothetical protein